MNDYKDVNILVRPVVLEKKLHLKDRQVQGVYKVWVDKAIPLSAKASAAMDILHCEVPLENPDDFEFIVYDPGTGVFISENTQNSYAYTDIYARCIKISNTVPDCYNVMVEAIGDDKNVAILGSILIVADDQKTASDMATAVLWDPRLDSASCTPRCQVEIT
jgi:hypothetical protein